MPPMRRRSVAPFDCVSWLRSVCQTRCEKSTSEDKSHSTDSAHGEMHLRSYELKCDLSISVDLNLSNYELTRCQSVAWIAPAHVDVDRVYMHDGRGLRQSSTLIEIGSRG